MTDMALRSSKNLTDVMEGVQIFLVAFMELRTFITVYAELTKKLLESILDRVVVDRVGDELDQEKYLAVSMVRPRSSMEAAYRQRRAM